jgi:hypothetical protein
MHEQGKVIQKAFAFTSYADKKCYWLRGNVCGPFVWLTVLPVNL